MIDEQVRAGLSASQKRLPAALLYDALGSTLFEAITLLPEYPLTRVGRAMLQQNASALLARLPGPLEVAELGPGHGEKARLLLEPLCERQGATRFIGIDVSGAALEACRQRLSQLPKVTVATVEGTFIDGLMRAPAAPPGHRRLVLFLGSNISNFNRLEAQQFLSDVRKALRPSDALLLGADLDKSPERLLPAYDDALGVTAAFNKNVLVRLNRDYGAQFDLSAFAHEARWSAGERRIEMHLRALRRCDVAVSKLSMRLHFEEGETLWTESSHRFAHDELVGFGAEAGLRHIAGWVDRDWPFAQLLFEVS